MSQPTAAATPDVTAPAAAVLPMPDKFSPDYARVQSVRVEIAAVARRAALAAESLKRIVEDPEAAAALASRGINAAEVLRTLRHASAEPTQPPAAALPSDHS